MEDENDESWLYGNSEGKESSEQPPGTQDDAGSEKAESSKEKDSTEDEAPPADDPNETHVSF